MDQFCHQTMAMGKRVVVLVVVLFVAVSHSQYEVMAPFYTLVFPHDKPVVVANSNGPNPNHFFPIGC